MLLHTWLEDNYPNNHGLSVDTLPLYPEIVQAYARYLVRQDLQSGRATVPLDVFLLLYHRA